jgi:hypothetical protein
VIFGKIHFGVESVIKDCVPIVGLISSMVMVAVLSVKINVDIGFAIEGG